MVGIAAVALDAVGGGDLAADAVGVTGLAVVGEGGVDVLSDGAGGGADGGPDDEVVIP